MKLTRRQVIRAAGASALTLPGLNALLWSHAARAAIGDTLTIAYNAAPAGWDPNTGPQTTSPGNQSIYRSIFDPYVIQNADLTLGPGVCDEFGWNADKSSKSWPDELVFDISLRVKNAKTSFEKAISDESETDNRGDR